MPNGLLQKPADFITYSEPNINTVLKLDAPMVVISNAEMNFLMAEAIVRGWASGDAASYYQGGISASMRNMAIYGDAAAISTAKINAYLATHTFLQVLMRKWNKFTHKCGYLYSQTKWRYILTGEELVILN
jgi:hypothetical protein